MAEPGEKPAGGAGTGGTALEYARDPVIRAMLQAAGSH